MDRSRRDADASVDGKRSAREYVVSVQANDGEDGTAGTVPVSRECIAGSFSGGGVPPPKYVEASDSYLGARSGDLRVCH